MAYGLILTGVAWAMAAVIISLEFHQKSFLILSALAILALLSTVSGVIMASRLLPAPEGEFASTSESDVRVATGIHLGGLCGYLIPLASLLLPFWLWKSYRRRSRFICNCGVQALNFQLTCSVYFLGALMLVPLLAGFVILPAVIVYHVFFTLRAVYTARKHQPYKYPGNLNFIAEINGSTLKKTDPK